MIQIRLFFRVVFCLFMGVIWEVRNIVGVRSYWINEISIFEGDFFGIGGFKSFLSDFYGYRVESYFFGELEDQILSICVF